MVPIQSRWVVATTLLVALDAGQSFQITPRISPIQSVRGISPQYLTLDHYYLESRRDHSGRNYPKNTRSWSTDEGSTNEPDDESSPAAGNESYKDLYEFLTRRTGEQAGESERRRKRDRIRDWMGSSASSSNAGSLGGAGLVRPIRMEDGSVVEDEPPQTQARFEKLFSRMPTLDEIVSRDGAKPQEANVQPQNSPSSEGEEASEKNKTSVDDSWFDEEKKQIEAEYEQIIEDMKNKIRQQREEDPDSMPENAEGVAESIVRQELERMLGTVKLTRAKERLEEYQINRMSELDSRDLNGAKDDVVERMLKDAAEEWKRKEALQAELDEFLRYENEARANLSGSSVPQPGADLDAWALERLENMLETTEQKASESGAAVSDIIEQQIDDLKERIEKESRKGHIKPQTMKEWQMFRAISNRLGRERGFDPKIDAALSLAELDEDQVAERLKSWREYVGKEEEIRKKSGLSVGTRMPFDWHRADSDYDQDQHSSTSGGVGIKTLSRTEMRREVNIKALKAFEELIQKSDPARSENLKKQLEVLRAQLEPLDYVDVNEDVQDQGLGDPAGPVDLSGIFGQGQDFDTESTLPSRLYGEEREAIDRVLASDASSIYEADENSFERPSSPQSSFFSDFPEDDESKLPPPRTPFFDDASGSGTQTIDVENTKLGSADDQKLLNMYRRAGARTKEEQDAIREQWEGFQEFEKARRDASGLSDDESSTIKEGFGSQDDMSEFMTSDGDFDAQKVLSKIGPRPTRKKKDREQQPTIEEASGEESAGSPKSKLDAGQVPESLFPSFSAVGGGEIKEAPEGRETQKSDSEGYFQREEELRRSLDNLDEEAKKLAIESGTVVDDSYAQNALASIDPRPVFEREMKESEGGKNFSDRGVGAASDDGDEDEDEDDDDNASDVITSSVDLMPDWMKEKRTTEVEDDYDSRRGFSGRNVDKILIDDQYDHNQRQLHEYEQGRSGRQKQMGIDISDILGSRARGPDDEANYSYDTDYFRGRQSDWGATSFEARKANLLEYVELSIPELNNLMDYRESVYATGVSQYLARINKPFKEFGAVFRLEGVLLDLTGLHADVWRKVASEFEFRQPIEEEFNRAAVVCPQVAIREVFYWTNDMFVVREVISCFHRLFNEAFEEWASSNGLSEDLSEKRESQHSTMTLEAEAISGGNSAPRDQSPTAPRLEGEQSKLKRFQDAWSRTAHELELPIPTNEQVAQSTFLAPEIAVREVFKWTSDVQDIEAVVSVFNAIFNGDVEGIRMATSTADDDSQNISNDSSLLEAQYKAWTKVAEEKSFEPPTPEEVLAAAVLNDAEAVIMNGFGWTSSISEARGLAELYKGYLRGFLHGEIQPLMPSRTEAASVEAEQFPEGPQGPTDEEVLETQIQAWSETAARHRFTPPKPDQIQLTMNLRAGDAVRRLLGWTYNFNEDQISEITETYSEALKKASEKYVEAYDLEVTTVEAPSPVPGKKGKELTGDDIFNAAFDAWTNVAWQSGFSLPNQEQVQFAMAVGPEEAIVSGFRWADSYIDATGIVEKYRNQIKQKRAEWSKQGYDFSSSGEASGTEKVARSKVMTKPGVADWVKSLLKVEMACGVTSYLEEHQVDILLQYAGLSDLLPRDKRVSMTDGYDRDSQQMLGAALRIERRPDHCVVFDSSPGSNAAAHEVDMRSVAMVGPYPRYELLSADASALSFDELTAMNIRRLFGERVYDQPMLDTMQNQPDTGRGSRTTFWDGE